MLKASLANRPPGATGGWTLQLTSALACSSVFSELAGAVGRVAVDRQPLLVRLAL